jgi:carboxylesterase
MTEMANADLRFFYPGGRTGVLLIHGLTGTPLEMKFVGRQLARRGYTVYGMQLAGHGVDAPTLLKTGWRDWCASALDAHAQLAAEVDRVFVAGLSMGALLALHLAALRPAAVHGVGLYAPILRYDGWAIPWTRHFACLLPLLTRLPGGRRRVFPETYPFGIRDDRLRELMVARLQAGDAANAGLAGFPWPSLVQFQKLVRDLKPRLGRVRAPCLIVHPVNDDVADARNALAIGRRLGGPVQYEWLQDSYHIVTVDRQRARVVEATADFMLRHGLAARPTARGEVDVRGDCRPVLEAFG